ncbi:27 kDa lipoprotein antigen [Mycobacterium tuberculosis]|nr:27 kDa lipoprotein antigen [Mycobacterium tuberculosis]
MTVNDKTKYSKQVAADTQAVTAGKCLTAKGTQDANGALQATTINLRPAHDGKCAGQAGHHGHGG